MREIKFRGRRKNSDEWVYGAFLAIPRLCSYIYDVQPDGQATRYLVDEDTVGQFTGLKDSEGREIYEGDVVRHENCICLVVYNSTRFASFALRKDGWAFDHYFGEAFDASECQVIGNVHDNPELLEAEA